jgi:hypothetical protein
MIEENTISLAVTRSPSLSEIGLDEEERKRLERIGVSNAAQLERLGQSTGARAVSRLSGISAERLRQAVTQSRPRLTSVEPAPPPAPAKPPVVTAPPRPQPAPPIVVKPKPRTDPLPPPRPAPPVVRPPKSPAVQAQPAAPISKNVIQVEPNTRRLQLFGANLIGETGAPQVFFNNQALGLVEAEDDRLVIELPEDLASGALEIALPDGQQLTYELSVANGIDPWEPQ